MIFSRVCSKFLGGQSRPTTSVRIAQSSKFPVGRRLTWFDAVPLFIKLYKTPIIPSEGFCVLVSFFVVFSCWGDPIGPKRRFELKVVDSFVWRTEELFWLWGDLSGEKVQQVPDSWCMTWCTGVPVNFRPRKLAHAPPAQMLTLSDECGGRRDLPLHGRVLIFPQVLVHVGIFS